MATEKHSNIDEAEEFINFCYYLHHLLQIGDTAGLEKAKKEYPDAYAEWERRTAAME